MKTRLTRRLALLFLGTALLQLQALEPKLDDFVGIRWGASMADAKTLMKSARGLDIIPASSNASMLYFEGGSFGQWRAKRWNLWFVDDQFHSGRVMVLPAGKRDRAFAEVKKALTEKYGIPADSEHKGWPSCRWHLKATVSDKSEKGILLTDNPKEEGPRIQYSNLSMKKPETPTGDDL